jgi:hypothetical protein
MTLDWNSTSLAAPYNGFIRSAICPIQPPMVLHEISTPCRSKIFSCRFNGTWPAVLTTITSARLRCGDSGCLPPPFFCFFLGEEESGLGSLSWSFGSSSGFVVSVCCRASQTAANSAS